MQSNVVTQYGKISIGLQAEKDYAIVKAHGNEVYQLTNKASGEVSLAAFESPVAAKRFFAGTKDFFFTKLFSESSCVVA